MGVFCFHRSSAQDLSESRIYFTNLFLFEIKISGDSSIPGWILQLMGSRDGFF